MLGHPASRALAQPAVAASLPSQYCAHAATAVAAALAAAAVATLPITAALATAALAAPALTASSAAAALATAALAAAHATAIAAAALAASALTAASATAALAAAALAPTTPWRDRGQGPRGRAARAHRHRVPVCASVRALLRQLRCFAGLQDALHLQLGQQYRPHDVPDQSLSQLPQLAASPVT